MHGSERPEAGDEGGRGQSVHVQNNFSGESSGSVLQIGQARDVSGLRNGS